MRISELPTPRLRARAMELYIDDAMSEAEDDEELSDAFHWECTRETEQFWKYCNDGIWNKAKELQPDLFKPVDGKPHIYLHIEDGLDSIALCVAGNYQYKDRSNPIIAYIMEVNPNWYPTIQEAVDALYSYKRGEK